MTDVIVVGGGPAGAMTAALLAPQGLAVTVLDRARFPRDKACGEFLTPGAAGVLRQAGVWDAVVAAGVRPVPCAVLHAPSGAAARYVPADGQPAGWAVRRVALDAALLDFARGCGAQVCEGVNVRGLLRRDGVVVGVASGDEDGGTRELECRLVIGADGTHSHVARGLGVVRPLRRLQRLAVVSHWGGVRGVAIEMRSRAGIVCGWCPLGDGTANVTVVAPRSSADSLAGRPEAFLDATFRTLFPDLAARLRGAELEAPVRTVGCFSHLCRPPGAPGALLVGDAAAFVDPFTGEGIYHAVRGAQIAADVAGRALKSGTVTAEVVAEYARARRELDRRQVLCRIVQAVVRTPALMERAIRRLARDPRVSERLLSVLGDVRPAADALHPAMALRLLRG